MLVCSKGMQPLDEHIFTSYGTEFHTQSITIYDSEGYISNISTQTLGHIDEFRKFYLQSYSRDDQTINVKENYNITHISERAFEWASDIVVSKLYKAYISFQNNVFNVVS